MGTINLDTVKMGELFDNPAARTAIEKLVPGASNYPLDMIRGMSFREASGYILPMIGKDTFDKLKNALEAL